MIDNPFVGNWTYRSFLNDPDVNKAFNDLEFGRGTIVIEEAPMQSLHGTIGGPGWSLALKGARQYGNPMHARFQGVGIINGEQWIYDYDGYLVPDWPNGVDQIPAIAGSVPAGCATALSLASFAPELRVALVDAATPGQVPIGETVPPQINPVLV